MRKSKYTNISLTKDEAEQLMEIGQASLAPYGVTVTLPAVIRYMIVQQKAIHLKNKEMMEQAIKGMGNE